MLTEKYPAPATNGIRILQSSPKLRAVPIDMLQSIVARLYLYMRKLTSFSVSHWTDTGEALTSVLFSFGMKYEGWNFNSGNYLFTTDTKKIHVSKFYCPSV